MPGYTIPVSGVASSGYPSGMLVAPPDADPQYVCTHVASLSFLFCRGCECDCLMHSFQVMELVQRRQRRSIGGDHDRRAPYVAVPLPLVYGGSEIVVARFVC